MTYSIIDAAGTVSLGGVNLNPLNAALGTPPQIPSGLPIPQLPASFSTLGAYANVAGPYATSGGDVDTVGVFDSDFVQLFRSCRPIQVSVGEGARVFEHPVESGGVITDWRVIMPIEISMTAYIQADDYRNVYQAIKAIYTGNDLVTVQTKSGTYLNMLLTAMPHEEDAELVDILAMQLRFKEAIIISAQFQALTKDDTDTVNTSTIDRGEQAVKSSILFDTGRKIGLIK